MGPLFSPVSSYTRQSQLQLETYVLAPFLVSAQNRKRAKEKDTGNIVGFVLRRSSVMVTLNISGDNNNTNK